MKSRLTMLIVTAVLLVTLSTGAAGATDTIHPQAKLTASDGAAGDFFGWSVALDHDTALIGSPLDDGARGSAYIFTSTGSGWNQQIKLTAVDSAANTRFGDSVALQGDIALVGAPGDGPAGGLAYEHQGSVYVFTRTSEGWRQSAKLTAADGAMNDSFGAAVALSGDTALVGACDKDTSKGAAYVFTRSSAGWTQQAKLIASNGAANDYFGFSLALDGDTALIGVPGYNAFQGSAYIFNRTGTTWAEQAKLIANDRARDDEFALTVALEGDTALIGATGARDASNNLVLAYAFTRTNQVWQQQAKLTTSDGAVDYGLNSVALSGDIALTAVGDHAAPGGAAYLFTRTDTTWSEQHKLTADDGIADNAFGGALALDGAKALVSAHGWEGGPANMGAVYAFALPTYADPGGVCAGHAPCYTSWQAAVDAAGAGNSVWVYPGTYDEAVSVTQDLTVTLQGAVTLTGALTLQQGTLDLNGYTLTLLDHLHNAGTLINGAGTLAFSGTTPQIISGSSSQTFNNLTINNPAGVTLNVDSLINNRLALQSGRLVLGSSNLSLGASASITGSLSAANMLQADGSGELRKVFSGAGSFTFPVGDNTGADGAQYTPVTLTFTRLGSAGYVGVRVTDAAHPQSAALANRLSRYWTLTAGDGLANFDCQAVFSYDAGDVVGTEGKINGGMWHGTTWAPFGLVNASDHTFGGQVTTFSDFTSGPLIPLWLPLIANNLPSAN